MFEAKALASGFRVPFPKLTWQPYQRRFQMTVSLDFLGFGFRSLRFRGLGSWGLGFRVGRDGRIFGVQGLGSGDYSSLAFGTGILYGS